MDIIEKLKKSATNEEYKDVDDEWKTATFEYKGKNHLMLLDQGMTMIFDNVQKIELTYDKGEFPRHILQIWYRDNKYHEGVYDDLERLEFYADDTFSSRVLS